MSDGRHMNIMEKIRHWSPRKKILVLLVISLAAYGSVIAVQPITDHYFGSANMHQDVAVYRARTETILHGGLLYRDVHTETPPLICYLMVVPEVLGGGDFYWVYSIYFSAFGFLCGCISYLALRRFDELDAFLVGVLFVLSPFGFIEAGTGEDETIVAFTVIVPAVLMLYEQNRKAAVAATLGVWTKMWSLLLLPVQFLRCRTWKDRGVFLGIAASISAVVATPFLALCYDRFTWFIRYYFIEVSGRESEGSSVWYYLKAGGYGVPKEIELAITLVTLMAAYIWAYRRKMGVWETMTVVFVAFFAVYPKIHTGYFLIPLSFLFVWAAEDRRIAARCFAMYVPWALSLGFDLNTAGASIFSFPGSWIVGLLLSLTTTVVLIDTARLALKKKPFVSRSPSVSVPA